MTRYTHARILHSVNGGRGRLCGTGKASTEADSRRVDGRGVDGKYAGTRQVVLVGGLCDVVCRLRHRPRQRLAVSALPQRAMCYTYSV